MISPMFKSVPSLAAFGAVLGLLHATAAAGAPVKVWVASFGTDNATCGSTSFPCRGFQRAHDNVAPGGDIGVLTPLEFTLALTIIKSVSITNDGAGEASILITPSTAFATAVEVLANPGDVISLRGLVIDGQGIGSAGIQVDLASALHMQNCVIRNVEGLNAWGLVHHSNGQLFVSDTIIYNNGSTAGTGGLLIQPNDVSRSVRATLDRVHLENNVVGLWVAGNLTTSNGSRVLVRDSVVSGNASDGIFAVSAAGKAPAFAVIERTTSVNNGGIGIHADGPRATLLLHDNVITQNGTGISATNGGQLISYGNNKNNNNIGPEGTATGQFGLM